MHKTTIKNQWIGLFFLLLSVSYLLLFFDWSTRRFVFIAGDDFSFHLSRVFNMANDIKQTGWPSYLSEFGISRVMYGLNFFYPSLTTIVPLAYGTVGLGSAIKAYYFYFVGLNLMTLWLAYKSSFYLFQPFKISERALQQAAILFAVCYSLSAYRLVDLTTRFALGEAVALSFLPLVVAGFVSIYFRDGKKWYWLAAGLSLICYTHLLSVFLTGVLLSLGCLIYLRQLNWRRIRQLLAAGGLTLLLAAGSLVPLVEQLRYIKIASVHPYQLNEQAQPLFKILTAAFGNRLNQQTIGLWTIVVLVGGVFYFRRSAISRLGRQSFYWSLGLLVSLTTFFPWQWLQATPLKNIQFPFRLTAFLVLFSCVLAVDLLKTKLNFALVLGLTFALLSVNLISNAQAIQQKEQTGDYRHDYLLPSDHEIKKSRRFQLYNNTDYFPKAALEFRGENGDSLYSKTLFLNGKAQPLPYRFVGGQTRFTLKTPRASNQVDLPLLAYKGVQVTVNQKRVANSVSKRGTIKLALAKGVQQVTVFYRPTTAVIVAWLISGVTLVGFVFRKMTKKR